MKGIVLAGGSGTRLHPLTYGVSKQLLPVYDKPMIYYPLSTLMLAGVRDILLITTIIDQPQFVRLLGDGSQWGVNISYAVQIEPKGIAEAFIIAEDFIANDNVILILGDNIFYSDGLTKDLQEAINTLTGAYVFASYVDDPHRYGVVSFGEQNKATHIEEKPDKPRSNYAVTGLYLYDSNVCEIAKSISPSARGELEITDVNSIYLNQNLLTVHVFGRGMAWLDAGTHESLLDANNFVSTIEKRQGLKIGCLDEVAFRKGWISKDELALRAQLMSKTQYGIYLQRIVNSIYISC